MNKLKVVTAVAALGVIVVACATPRVSFHTPGPNGSMSGNLLMALPQMSIEFTEQEEDGAKDDGKGDDKGKGKDKGRGGSQASEDEQRLVTHRFAAQGKLEQSSVAYIVRPERLRWLETRLAPTYVQDTNILQKLSIQTVDRRVSFVQSVLSFAGSLGINLQAASETYVPCSYRMSAAQVARLMDGVPRTGSAEEIDAIPTLRTSPEINAQEAAALSETTCRIRMRIGAVPPDAVLRSEFEGLFVRPDTGGGGGVLGHRGVSEVIPYAACRRVEIWLNNRQNALSNAVHTEEEYIPDLNYVRVVRMPYKATMNFSRTCSPVDITDVSDPEKTDLQVWTEIFNVLRGEEEKAKKK